MEPDDYYMFIHTGTVKRLDEWEQGRCDEEDIRESEDFLPVQRTETDEEREEFGDWKPWTPK